MSSQLDAMARRVIDANSYMTLGTTDDDRRPRLSPVYYHCAAYRRFYWVSSPRARHSLHIEARPDVAGVIFDSTAEVGRGEAVFFAADARAVAGEDLDRSLDEAFGPTEAVSFTATELHELGLSLYVAELRTCEVHVPGRHPTFGRGLDSRQPATPHA